MRRGVLFTLLAAGGVGVSGMDNGLALKPHLGWNTWQTCDDVGGQCIHDGCSEKEVKEVALAMQANGMQALGYNYVNLDDCWAYPRNETTKKLRWDPSRFPSGIPVLTEWLHKQGFKFGLYTSAGHQTCSSGGRNATIPGSRDYFDLDAQTFADWGVDFVKFDWCGDIKKEVWLGAQAHRDFASAMNKTGRPMVLDVVAGFWFLRDKISQYANSWRFCEDHHDAWKSLKEQLYCRADQKTLGVVGSPGGWANMDFLMTGGQGCKSPLSHCPGMTEDEYAVEFVIWALTQSPLIVDTDVRNMSGIMQKALLNEEIIQLHQNTSTPPGKMLGYWSCSELFACQLWGRQTRADASEWIVALVNVGREDHTVTLEFSKLGWKRDTQAAVRDVWDHEDIGGVSGKFEAAVQSHAMRIIKLSRQN